MLYISLHICFRQLEKNCLNKMKKIIVLTLLYLLSNNTFSQTAWSDQTRVLPDKLRNIETGIRLEHSPSPNYPEMNVNKSEDALYVWQHSTFVTALNQNLEVVEAGSFIWYSAEGWKKNIKYNKEDFTKSFSCKNGLLQKGKVFTFKKNYRYANNLFAGDALWFVIARDKNGKLFKGVGLIETEKELKK